MAWGKEDRCKMNHWVFAGVEIVETKICDSLWPRVVKDTYPLRFLFCVAGWHDGY
jgi:hypothetical protein